MAEYIPTTSQRLDKLTPDLQKMTTDIWAQHPDLLHLNMAAAQTKRARHA